MQVPVQAPPQYQYHIQEVCKKLLLYQNKSVFFRSITLLYPIMKTIILKSLYI
jgi:hypothetical protein